MVYNAWLMKRLILLGLFLLTLACPSLYAERVRHVYDGDTVILTNRQKIRLIGIDAPEIENRKYNRRGEAFGLASKAHLASMIQGKEVRLEDGPEAFDKYGRRLAFIFLPDGTFVNQKMVEDGYAETFRRFPFQYKEKFLELEKKAQEERKGMWGPRKKSFLHRWNSFWKGEKS